MEERKEEVVLQAKSLEMGQFSDQFPMPIASHLRLLFSYYNNRGFRMYYQYQVSCSRERMS